ncbi:biopolymer transport protein TolR [Roseomonas rosea]|uniref:Biopolymer transport protein TolR n=1 Tax=Muricoccus roseus TaxID=198092 RepID=A0A1M6NUE4_9PROT|nr:ExbD/TolR family protein [Roseomonas rosea]SHJ99335.1 biopolymer transport protein TolR [Roseomonas rosea]
MAMSVGGGLGDDEDGAPMGEMNVTPLVDVMLVLLIIFMVAAPMMTVGVPVNLPRTAAARTASSNPPVILTVAPGGKLYVGKEEVTEDALTQRLVALHEADPEAPVHVRGDRSVPYGDVLRVMGRVSRAGITKVSLIAEADAAAPAVQAR